jgi:hypothetical protein
MKALENKLRRQLQKSGYRLEKSRIRNKNVDNQGGYMIIKTYTNAVHYGDRYQLTIEDVQEIVKDLS